jgi:hypothetical protein
VVCGNCLVSYEITWMKRNWKSIVYTGETTWFSKSTKRLIQDFPISHVAGLSDSKFQSSESSWKTLEYKDRIFLIFNSADSDFWIGGVGMLKRTAEFGNGAREYQIILCFHLFFSYCILSWRVIFLLEDTYDLVCAK